MIVMPARSCKSTGSDSWLSPSESGSLVKFPVRSLTPACNVRRTMVLHRALWGPNPVRRLRDYSGWKAATPRDPSLSKTWIQLPIQMCPGCWYRKTAAFIYQSSWGSPPRCTFARCVAYAPGEVLSFWTPLASCLPRSWIFKHHLNLRFEYPPILEKYIFPIYLYSINTLSTKVE